MMASIRFNQAFIAVPGVCLLLVASLTFAQPVEPLNEAVRLLGDYQETLQAQRDKLETAIAARHEKAQEFGQETEANIERIKVLAADSDSSGGELLATLVSKDCTGRFQASWDNMGLELQQLQREYKENLAQVRLLSATLQQVLKAAEPVAGE